MAIRIVKDTADKSGNSKAEPRERSTGRGSREEQRAHAETFFRKPGKVTDTDETTPPVNDAEWVAADPTSVEPKAKPKPAARKAAAHRVLPSITTATDTQADQTDVDGSPHSAAAAVEEKASAKPECEKEPTPENRSTNIEPTPEPDDEVQTVASSSSEQPDDEMPSDPEPVEMAEAQSDAGIEPATDAPPPAKTQADASTPAPVARRGRPRLSQEQKDKRAQARARAAAPAANPQTAKTISAAPQKTNAPEKTIGSSPQGPASSTAGPSLTSVVHTKEDRFSLRASSRRDSAGKLMPRRWGDSDAGRGNPDLPGQRWKRRLPASIR